MISDMKVSDISKLGIRANGFSAYRQLFDVVPYSDSVSRDSDVRDFPDKQLFDLVFAVNPRTDLPDGDLQMYLSKNTRPEVRTFIEQVLRQDNGQLSDTSQIRGLSDDDIQNFSRGSDESLSDYRLRLYNFVKDSVSKKDAK